MSASAVYTNMSITVTRLPCALLVVSIEDNNPVQLLHYWLFLYVWGMGSYAIMIVSV